MTLSMTLVDVRSTLEAAYERLYGSVSYMIPLSHTKLIPSTASNIMFYRRQANRVRKCATPPVHPLSLDRVPLIRITLSTSPAPLRFQPIISHWAHDVVATLNQRQWRWFNVASTSCVRAVGCRCRLVSLTQIARINRALLNGDMRVRFKQPYIFLN